MEDCTNCSLHKDAYNVCMYGKGKKNSKIMVVSDAPTFEENKANKVFGGKLSEGLKISLENRGISLDDVYFTYAVKCPVDPGDSKMPKEAHAKACREYLDAEIAIINPEIIIPLGNMALKSVAGKVGITKARGKAIEVDGRIILPTYHPRATLKFPGYKPLLLKDLDTIASLYKEGMREVSSVGYRYCETFADAIDELDRLEEEGKYTVFDIETTGNNPYYKNSKIVCISFSNEERTGSVIPLYHRQTPFNEIELKKIVKRLKKFMENKHIAKGAHNGKFDMEWLKYWLGIEVANFSFDTILAHYLAVTEERGTHDLKTLAWEYTDMGGYDNELDEYKATLPESERYNYDNIPWEILKKYSIPDADCCLRLTNLFKPLIDENPSYSRCMYEIYIPASYALMDVRSWGMKMDIPLSAKYEKVYTEEMERLANRLHEFPEVLEIEREKQELYLKRQALLKSVPAKNRTEEQKDFIKKTQKYKDYEFNFGSTQQLGELLFDRLGLTTEVLTDSGNPSTNEDALNEMESQHPIPALLLELRKVATLTNMFVKKLPSMVDSDDIVHPTLNLIGTVTARLSSEDPNAQQMPRKVENPTLFQYHHEIKKLFISRFGEMGCFMQADYSQLELRLAGLFSKDSVMREIFLSGQDLHTSTASKIYNLPFEKVTKDLRSKAKEVNFGIVYGKTGHSFANTLFAHLPKKQAKREGEKLVSDYLNTFSGLSRWIEKTKKSAHEIGYVETLFGTRRRLPNLRSRIPSIKGEAERQAVNTPIQGTGSFMTLLSVIKIVDYINKNNLKSRLVVTVHDSIGFDVYIPELPELFEVVKDTMENIYEGWFECDIPIRADIEVGDDYGTLFEMEHHQNINTVKLYKAWVAEELKKKKENEITYLREKVGYSDKQIEKYLKKWA